MVDLKDEDLPLSLDPGGLPIHGLLSAAEDWRVERHQPTPSGGVLEAHFDFTADRQLISAYPFPHQLTFEATLSGAVLRISTTVQAGDEAAVPISFGFHPYLRLPGVERRDWQVEIPVAEHLELDGQMLPTGERRPVTVEPGPLGARTFDDGYLAPTGKPPSSSPAAGGGSSFASARATGSRRSTRPQRTRWSPTSR